MNIEQQDEVIAKAVRDLLSSIPPESRVDAMGFVAAICIETMRAIAGDDYAVAWLYSAHLSLSRPCAFRSEGVMQ